MSTVNIPKKLEKLKRFTYREALTHGLTKRNLVQLLCDGEVHRVSRGLYAISTPTDENQSFATASKIVGFPSAICFWSALVYYDLTDEIDRKTWIMAPADLRRSHKNIKLVRLKNPQWNIGIIREKDYWITTIERTIIDSLLYPRFVGSMAATVALKRAMQRKKTNVSKLIEIATQLNCLKKVYPRLEVFVE